MTFETVHVGIGMFADIAWDVRLVRSGDEWFVVLALAAEGPFTSEAEARAWCDRRFDTVAWDIACNGACAICAAPLQENPRHRRELCPACVLEAVDERGRTVRFYNGRIGDGECWVRGVRCRAREAYFGGIVLERDDGS